MNGLSIQGVSNVMRPSIALDREPKHLDILIHNPGTALKVYAAGAHSAEETLFTFKHSLGYKPQVLIYFYQKSNGFYSVGKLFYAYGIVDDYLCYETDENNLYIKHKLIDNVSALNYTSTAPSQGKIQIKYMIFSIPENKLTTDS